MSARGSLVVAVLTVLSLIQPSRAAAESMEFLGLGLNSVVTVAGPSAGPSYPSYNVYAGEIRWAWQGSAPAGFADTFYTYCVDILNYLTSPQTVDLRSTTGLVSDSFPVSPDAGGKAAWLLNQYADSVHASGSGLYAAALQVAIWEALYDAANDLGAGAFRLITSGVVQAKASEFLTALYSNPSGGYHTSTAIWLDTRNGQDQITRVPEPGTLSLLGLGLVLFSARGRRSRVQEE